MRLRPGVAELLARAPLATAGFDPVAAQLAHREGARLLDLPRPADVAVRDLRILGPGGPVGLRCYTPAVVADEAVVLFFHGGGWMLGDLDTHDGLAGAIADGLGMRLVAVDYRRAPEHVFPAALDDCRVALEWVASAPEEIGAAPEGIVLAGDSAGGNLATACALAWGLEPTVRAEARAADADAWNTPFDKLRANGGTGALADHPTTETESTVRAEPVEARAAGDSARDTPPLAACGQAFRTSFDGVRANEGEGQRDEGVHLLALWTMYASFEMDAAGGSLDDYATGHLLTADLLAIFRDAYFADAADRLDPRASPLLAPDLSHMPATLVFANECDPLRDQSRAFAARLAEAGRPVRYREAWGHVHGSLARRAAVPSGCDDLAGCLADLRALIAEARVKREQQR